VNVIIKFEMEHMPWHMKNLKETPNIEICQQAKATFQLTRCSECCPFMRMHCTPELVLASLISDLVEDSVL